MRQLYKVELYEFINRIILTQFTLTQFMNEHLPQTSYFMFIYNAFSILNTLIKITIMPLMLDKLLVLTQFHALSVFIPNSITR